MTELLLSWLNDEVQLSKKITNFEKDFANGYYFGELLHKYNQQLNFQEFQNKDLRNAQMINFNLLFPTFKTLKVPFDSSIVHKVQNSDKNVATSLLYQLRMALEKVTNPADVLIYSKTGKYNTVTPLKKIMPPKDQYDKMEKTFFNQRIQELNKGQKEINLDTHLFPFADFKKKQDEIIKKHQYRDEQEKKNVKDELRKISLNKLQRNMAFMEDWQQKGIENWQKNHEIRRKREEADRTFKKKQDETQKNRLQKMQELTKNEVYDDIAAFEQTLKKQGLGASQNGGMMDEENEDFDEYGQQELEGTKKIENKSLMSTALGSYKIKESKQMSDWKRKERDKRRRKMIVDQQKIQREIEVNKRKDLIIEKLKQQSKQEKEIDYEIWRSQQCKEIIYQDRDLRDEKYKEKTDLNVQNAIYKEEEMINILKSEFEHDVELKLNRQKEIQIKHKQDKRRENYNICNNLVDQIFELAEISYKHQQNCDSDKIEEHFWNDQLKLFIAEKPLIQNIDERHFDVIENLKQQQEVEYKESKEYLGKLELEDYIQGRGQWIPQHQAEEEENPEKFTPQKPINNTLLGDLVVNVLGQVHQEDVQKLENQLKTNPDLLAIKTIIYGYQFSGKHTVTNLLTKKYDLAILKVDLLIQDLLNLVNQYSENEEQEIQGNEEQIQKDLELGRRIQDVIIKGEDLSDEIYVEVIMNKVNGLYPRVSEEQFLENYKNLPEIAQNKEENEQDIEQEKDVLQNDKYKYSQGWVLIDFPHTYNQSKLLEKALSGFVPKDEIEKSVYEERVERMNQIVKGTDIQIIPRQLINGGVDVAFYLSIQKQESLQRALGRRVDKQTDQQYHMSENLPPVDAAPLVERLEQIKHISNNENTIIDKNCEIDQNLADLEAWFSNFGFQKEVKTMVTVKKPVEKQQQQEQEAGDEEQQKEEEQLQEPEQAGLDEEKEKEKDLKKGSQKKIEEASGEKQQEQEQEAKEQEQEQQQQEQQQQEGEVEYEDVEEEQIEVQNVKSWQVVEGNDKIQSVFSNVDQYIGDLLESKKQKYEKLEQKKIEEQKKLEEQQEIERINKENENKLIFNEFGDIQTQISNIESEFKLDEQSLENLNILWKSVEENYLGETVDIFQTLRVQKETMISHFSEIQKRFLELLQRKDNKFFIIRKFQENYNSFVSENPDMCEEEVTKEELHQRVEDLHDQLFDIIECKKEDAIEERNQVMKTQWIENQMEQFSLKLQKLISAEIQRSFGCQQLISDYYTLMNRAELQEGAEHYKQDFVVNQEALPPVEEGESFPRLEKLYENAVLFSQGEVEVEGGDKNKKKQAKKDDKKAAKGGKKDEPEQVKEPTKQEIEMKEAINTEKQILRYRLNVLRDFGISKLKEMRSMASILYRKLEDWLNYTYQVENDAVDKILFMFQENIEAESKIQKELQLNYVDVVISHQVLNFLTPPPVILPARETIKENQFSISQLYIIIEELKNIMSQSTFQIQVNIILQLFTRKTQNNLTRQELPEIWRNLEMKDFQRLVVNLDRESRGYICGKDLCTIMCVLNCPVLTKAEQEQYLQELTAYTNVETTEFKLSKERFLDCPAPFDLCQVMPMEDNANIFDRPRYIKELLFFIHKDPETQLIDISSYLSSLSCKDYIGEDDAKLYESYNDILFK